MIKKALIIILATVSIASSDDAQAQDQTAKFWNQNLYLKLIINDQPMRFSDVEKYMSMILKGTELSKDQKARLRKLMNDMNYALYGEYLPKTSDIAVFRYSRASLRIQKYLEKKNPEACYNWLYGNKPKNQVLLEVDQDTLQEYKAALVEAVRQAISNPQIPRENFAANKIGKDVALKLKQNKRNFRFVNPANAKSLDEKLDVCRVSIAFTEILHTYSVEEISILTKSQFVDYPIK